MGRGPIPEGWNDYVRTGKRINKTRFIAFKVPLREGPNQNCNIEEENKWHPKLLVTTIPDIGIVIDITNTSRYYSPQDFLELGVDHKKIFVEGHQIPSTDNYIMFRTAVRDFLRNNRDNDKLIGVHCTHGLNRTGFLVCRYMIEEMKMTADEAISLFEDARGHKIKRENYIDKLKNLATQGSPSSESGSNSGGYPLRIPHRRNERHLPYALPPSRSLRTDGHHDNRRDSRPFSRTSPLQHIDRSSDNRYMRTAPNHHVSSRHRPIPNADHHYVSSRPIPSHPRRNERHEPREPNHQIRPSQSNSSQYAWRSDQYQSRRT